jgi:hypothetical protein
MKKVTKPLKKDALKNDIDHQQIIMRLKHIVKARKTSKVTYKIGTFKPSSGTSESFGFDSDDT